MAYGRLGQAQKAVPLYVALISGLRTSKQAVPPVVWSGYARALAATGELTQAATALRSAVRERPNDAALHGDLGSIYAQAKEWAKAEAEFKAEVALEPAAAMGHLRLGLAMQAQGEPGAAHEIEAAAGHGAGGCGRADGVGEVACVGW